MTGDVVKSSEGPEAVNSKLGWFLSGPIDSHQTTISSACLVIPRFDTKYDALVSTLHKFWEVESLGIAPLITEDLDSLLFPPRISFRDNRYCVSLLWKLDHPEAPCHLSPCEGRLKSLLCKLQWSPEILQDYYKIIRDQLLTGIIAEVELSNNSKSPSVCYLPYHGVVRQGSQTTKLRIVYDGSARGLGEHYCLNDCLETGPNFIPKLFNILVQF